MFNLFVVFSDLCLDISSIIVERSTLLPAILPGTLSKTPMTKIAYDTYAALLRLFIHYMSRVRHRVDQPPMNHMIDNEGTDYRAFSSISRKENTYFHFKKKNNYFSINIPFREIKNYSINDIINVLQEQS